MVLINLVKVNHLICSVQEKTPKIKRLIQYVKSDLFAYSVITSNILYRKPYIKSLITGTN